ncbi:MAG: zinc ribbon domain-containing protein [Chloroflexi bacterium]|nr:zinc ribbon domain-containing protein [Chloroflexota bacterium]
MPQKTVGYVELEWTCPKCKSRNPGSRRTCAGCGAPQPRDVQFEQPVQDQVITDEETIAVAAAGPDIHCAYCGARNPAGAKTCKQCGANLGEGAAREAGRVVGALQVEEAPPITCPSCGTPNPATALKCSKCGDSLVKPTPPPTPTPAPTTGGCGKWLLIMLAGIIILGAFLLYQGTRTTALTGNVSDLHWQRTIAIEALQPVTREDWRDQIPSGVQVGQCVKKVHHVQDAPVSGAREICGTPYVVDQGSGYGKAVQDCRYEVSADWCQYRTTAWVLLEPLVLEGADLNPRWPAATLGQNQRAGERTEVYKVTLTANDKTYTYRPADAQEYAQFKAGSRWTLTVNGFGGVTSIEPAR